MSDKAAAAQNADARYTLRVKITKVDEATGCEEHGGKFWSKKLTIDDTIDMQLALMAALGDWIKKDEPA